MTTTGNLSQANNSTLAYYDPPSYLHHLPPKQAVLNDGRGETLVSTAIAKLAVAIVAPTEQCEVKLNYQMVCHCNLV